MDLDLPVRRKKGRTDGFTLGVTQGPIPHLIDVETRKFFVCHVVDITSRNRIMITLVLHLVSEADGQVSRFLLQEQLVNFNFRVCTFPTWALRAACDSNSVPWWGTCLQTLMQDSSPGWLRLLQRKTATAKETLGPPRRVSSTSRRVSCQESSMTFFIVFHPEGCGQEKLTSLSSQEFGKKTGPSILRLKNADNRQKKEQCEGQSFKVREKS